MAVSVEIEKKRRKHRRGESVWSNGEESNEAMKIIGIISVISKIFEAQMKIGEIKSSGKINHRYSIIEEMRNGEEEIIVWNELMVSKKKAIRLMALCQ